MNNMNLNDRLSLIDMEVQALSIEAKAAIQAIGQKHKRLEEILIRVLSELEQKGGKAE